MLKLTNVLDNFLFSNFSFWFDSWLFFKLRHLPPGGEEEFFKRKILLPSL